MLVVDDEIYALRGITQGIDWGDLPFTDILEARDAAEAKRVLESRQVDLVVSDIEMPGDNGLELLRWIHAKRPDTLTVFQTGHARFDYAREALQLGCFDYVLKPVDHDLLKDIVSRAVTEIQTRRQRQAFEETLATYRSQWAAQLPILVERFWQDLLAERIPLAPERLNRQLESYGIPFRADGFVLPVLLSVEEWSVGLDARDESIMEYAVRKAAVEMIPGQHAGTALQDRGDLNLLLLLLGQEESVDRQALLERCGQYVEACQSYFHCRLSCYVGQPVRVEELSASLDGLLQMERSNVTAAQSVLDASQGVEGAGVSGGAGALLPSFADWAVLLDNGAQEELQKQLEETVRRLQEQAASRETLEQFRFGLLHLLYQTAHRKGVSVYESLTVAELNDPQVLRSPQLLLQWASRLIGKTAQAFQDRQKDTSAVIAKIHAYILENLDRDLNRDDIAKSVYRNPAYLSRLFRKETGLSLSEYITQQKIDRAKRMLTETNDKISNIAEGLGYYHFSYFAKLFKKMTGLSPQEYRKKHQTL